MQIPFETTEEEDKAEESVNSILADEDIFISEERSHAFVNGCTQSESVRRTYRESGYTDSEVVYAQINKQERMIEAQPASMILGENKNIMPKVRGYHGLLIGLLWEVLLLMYIISAVPLIR